MFKVLEGLIVLIGEEDEDWCYEETDLDWWMVRLWPRKN